MSDFSFDDWAKLYQSSPEEFDRKRTAVIETAILEAPVEIRNKLRVLQIECDVVRHTSDSPLAATVALSKMMAERLADLRVELDKSKFLLDGMAEQIKTLE